MAFVVLRLRGLGSSGKGQTGRQLARSRQSRNFFHSTKTKFKLGSLVSLFPLGCHANYFPWGAVLNHRHYHNSTLPQHIALQHVASP